MKKEELEKLLNRMVKLELFDGDIIEGILKKTGDECFKDNPNLYIPRNYYVLVDDKLNNLSCIFRVSHIERRLK